MRALRALLEPRSPSDRRLPEPGQHARIDAGLCDSPEQWPWSSYPGTIGLAEPLTFVDPSLVLGCLSENPAVAIADLRRFVEAPDDVILGRRAA